MRRQDSVRETCGEASLIREESSSGVVVFTYAHAYIFVCDVLVCIPHYMTTAIEYRNAIIGIYRIYIFVYKIQIITNLFFR